MSQRTPVSCLFFYKKRVMLFDKATNKNKLVLDKEGNPKENANFISFLQVISCYWECIDEATGKQQLNIFLNGGSVSRDRETGVTQMKAGFTVVLPQFIGERFMDEFYVWSCAFGLFAGPSIPQVRNTERSNTTRRPAMERTNRVVDEDEFAPEESDASSPKAYFEVEA